MENQTYGKNVSVFLEFKYGNMSFSNKTMTATYILYTYVGPVNAGLIIIINLFELWCILKTHQREKNHILSFMKNLSISDLLVAVMILLAKIMKAVEKSLKGNKVAREISSFAIYFSIRFSVCLSVLSLTIAVVMKMVVIKRNYKIKKALPTQLYIAAWVISSVLVIPDYVLMRLNVIPTNQIKYRHLFIPIITYTSTLMISCCYYSIYMTLRASSVRMLKHREINKNESARTQAEKPEKIRENQQKVKAWKKSILILVASFTAFSICMLPYATYQVCEVAGVFQTWPNAYLLNCCLQILTTNNSMVNPIIYFVVQRPKNVFRKRRNRQH